jgi:hypothetical protein
LVASAECAGLEEQMAVIDCSSIMISKPFGVPVNWAVDPNKVDPETYGAFSHFVKGSTRTFCFETEQAAKAFDEAIRKKVIRPTL